MKDDIKELAAAVLDELLSRGLTISIAESCTGGLVASTLTDLDGASEVLPYGIVAYSNEAKEEFLGIPGYVLQNFGAISLECAKLMAEGVIIYQTDLGLATTGVIGESIEGKLKGTVFIAIAVAGRETYARELKLDPNLPREAMKAEIVRQLFITLLKVIEEAF
ncbi:MAG: CinA family protein [Candidatus Heimdallarchaeota archaeon]|nr:CinA family protein [Candidatus Heimdallarchaeota archaeon]